MLFFLLIGFLNVGKKDGKGIEGGSKKMQGEIVYGRICNPVIPEGETSRWLLQAFV